MARVTSRLDRWLNWKSRKTRVGELRAKTHKSRIKGNKSVLLTHADMNFLLALAEKQIEMEKPDDL